MHDSEGAVGGVLSRRQEAWQKTLAWFRQYLTMLPDKNLWPLDITPAIGTHIGAVGDVAYVMRK